MIQEKILFPKKSSLPYSVEKKGGGTVEDGMKGIDGRRLKAGRYKK